MQKDTYFLSTGEIDRERLTITSRLCNPTALEFMKGSGLKPGMTVLEFGCGTGHMSCDIAKAIGPTGKVIATDYSEDQLVIARETAKQAGVSNIEFKLCDVREVSTLNMKFDFAYGRWVIFFTPDPEKTLAGLYEVLKPGGVLTYESINFEDSGHFSYPHLRLLDAWHEQASLKAKTLGLELNLANRLYGLFKKLHFKKLNIQTHQSVLVTPEEKSIYRLGMLTSKVFTMKHALMTPVEFDEMCEECEKLEQNDDVICGFFRNHLVSGVK